MKTLIILFCGAMLTAQVATSQTDYTRNMGADTVTFGAGSGKHMYAKDDTLFWRSGGINRKISPITDALTGTGTFSYIPYFTGAYTLGSSPFRMSGNNLEFYSASSALPNKLFFSAAGKPDTSFIYLNAEYSLGLLQKGMVIDSNLTVIGDLNIFGSLRGDLDAAYITSGTIDVSRLPPSFGIGGTGWANRMAYWSSSTTMMYSSVWHNTFGIGYPYGYGSRYYTGSVSNPLDSVQVTAGYTPFGYANGLAALTVNRDIDTRSIAGYAFRGQYATEAVTTASTVSLDWSRYSAAKVALGANVTFSFINTISTTYQTLTVVVDNSGSYTVTWPSNIEWKGGSAPSQTASQIDIYTFINIGGALYGSVVQDFDN